MINKIRQIVMYVCAVGIIACFTLPPYSFTQRDGTKVMCSGGWAFEPATLDSNWAKNACSVDWAGLAIRVLLFAAIAGATYAVRPRSA